MVSFLPLEISCYDVRPFCSRSHAS